MAREELDDGRIIERDELTGRIVSAHLSPAIASDMSRRGVEARNTEGRDLAEMLAEAGYSADNPPPAYARTMARQALHSPTAMRDWRRFCGYITEASSGDFESLGHYVVPEPGTRCSKCGAWNISNNYEALDVVREIVGAMREQRAAVEGENPRENDRANTVYRADHGENNDLHARIEAAEEAKEERAADYRRPLD